MTEEGKGGAVTSRPFAPPMKPTGLFVPRAAVSRPRAGLGHARNPGIGSSNSQDVSGPTVRTRSAMRGKGQEDFRKMLKG
jgi:hypothetical protein